jgi:hypothetical protein
MLEPDQFKENEAWLAFQLNADPIRTEQDGNFNCVALMDAASGFIFGTAFVSADEQEPPALEIRRLFKTSLERSNCNPATLFIPNGKFQVALSAEAKRHEITVVSVQESELLAFTEEARQGFREYVQGGRA